MKSCSTKEGAPSVHNKNIWCPASPKRARLIWMLDVAGEHCSGGASSGGASEVGMGSQVDDATTPVFS